LKGLGFAPLLTLAFLSGAEEEEAPKPEEGPYAVLKVVRGDEVLFHALPAKEAASEKVRITKDAKERIKAWESRRDAFQKDPANRGKDFLELAPDPAMVSLMKGEFPTQEEAETFAREAERKAERFVVVRVTDVDGGAHHEVLSQAGLKARLSDLYEEYAAKCKQWEEEMGVAATPGAAGKPGKATKPGKGGAKGAAISVSASAHPTKPRIDRVKDQIPTREEAEKLLSQLKGAR